MAVMMVFTPKFVQNILSKGGDCNKLYITELKAIYFWYFYREVTGINPTILIF